MNFQMQYRITLAVFLISQFLGFYRGLLRCVLHEVVHSTNSLLISGILMCIFSE
jgi:hypothetical protein